VGKTTVFSRYINLLEVVGNWRPAKPVEH